MHAAPLRLAALTCLFFGATVGWAQQSFFNIPSTELTPAGQMFFQQQFTGSSQELQSNTTFCYGLGHGWEIGVDLWNLDLGFQPNTHFESTVFDSGEAVAPLLAASALWSREVNDWWRLGVGAVVGTNLAAPIGARLVGLFYQSNVFTLPHGIHLHFGLFAGTPALMGRENVIANFFAGLEVPLFGPDLTLVADHYHGQHGLGVTVAGFAYRITPRFVLSVGYQEPNYPSELPRGVVLELTFPPAT